MRNNNEILITLAAAGDVLNVLGGGVSEPAAKLIRLTNSHRLEIKVPGVDPRKLSIEILAGTLNVFHVIEIGNERHNIPVPRSIFKKPIPRFINISGITASAVDDKLVIELPFNEHADGYRRKVSITEQ